jgi:hypothetical protein
MVLTRQRDLPQFAEAAIRLIYKEETYASQTSRKVFCIGKNT